MNVISPPIDVLYAKLGDKVRENVLLAPYTSARIGGPADVLITADSADELARTIKLLWKLYLEYLILGGDRVLRAPRAVRIALLASAVSHPYPHFQRDGETTSTPRGSERGVAKTLSTHSLTAWRC